MAYSIRQIRAFDAVAQTQSFTRAAEELNLTQSAVSMLVRQLEEAVGLPLFVRTGRGAILTEFGAQARPGFARVLAELSDIRDAAGGVAALQQGHLRLACPQILAASWLPKALGIYRAAHSDIQISVTDTIGDRVVEAVANNASEIGIGPARSMPPRIAGRHLWTVPMQIAVAASSPLAERARLREADLKALGWIHYSDEFTVLLEQRIALTRGGRRRPDMRVRGLSTALALLGRGDYATAAPAYAAVFAPVFDVHLCDMPGRPVVQSFLLYVREGHTLSPAAAAFARIAAENAPVGTVPQG